MDTQRTLYHLLGVEESADTEAITAAYFQRAETAGADASLLRVAYETLKNPQSRAEYDFKLQRDRAAPLLLVEHASVSRRGHHGRRWTIAVLLLILAGMGLLLSKTTLLFPKPRTASPPVAAAPAPTAPPATEPAEPAAEPAEASTPPPAPTPSGPVFHTAAPPPAPEKPVLKRERRKPGFDPEYLSWSVFLIRQSNLSGSGVQIGPDKILTNCHVLAGAALNNMVVTHSMTGKTTKVEKYARLDGEDACLVYAPNSGGETIEWGRAAELKQGDIVHSFGHPGGSAAVVWSEGQFLMRVERNGDEMLLSANYCRPGSSGGPLLDNNGRLVGIVTAVQRYVTRVGEPPRYGSCVSVTEATARALLGRPLFPIALAPAQYVPNY